MIRLVEVKGNHGTVENPPFSIIHTGAPKASFNMGKRALQDRFETADIANHLKNLDKAYPELEAAAKDRLTRICNS